MSANSNDDNIAINNERKAVAVDQSSELQVETLGTNLANGGLQEQIGPATRAEELPMRMKGGVHRPV
jgi:hypothetical protein